LEEKALEKSDYPAIKLYYFPAKGRGEHARVLLHEAGIPFEDIRMDHKTFVEKEKKTAPFGQMPFIDVGKVRIAQSSAINRYVAKIGGLYGHTLEESAKVDMIYEAINDIFTAFIPAHFEKDAKKKEEKAAQFWNETFPQLTGLLEKQLVANSKNGPFFVGNAVTMADIVLMVEGQRYLGLKPECLNNCPHLHQLITRVATRPNIAAWLKKRPADA